MVEPVKPFYDIVDALFNYVQPHMPQSVQQRPEASAFLYGFVGTSAVIKGLQLVSRHIIDNMFPGFDEKILPRLEQICLAGITAAPLLYAVFDPDSFRRILSQNPTYTSGMAGFWLGNVVGAVYDLHNRSVQSAIEKNEYKLSIE